jgi:hypothetical protein
MATVNWLHELVDNWFLNYKGALMSKVVTVLETIGKDFEKGLDAVLKAAAYAVPFLSAVDPTAGAVLRTTIGVISQTEQKFAAMGKQTGTGAQKLEDAMTILQPLLSVALGDAGKPATADKVSGYISAVVSIMNQPATVPTVKA